jgi:ribosomal protein L35AE/L33A
VVNLSEKGSKSKKKTKTTKKSSAKAKTKTTKKSSAKAKTKTTKKTTKTKKTTVKKTKKKQKTQPPTKAKSQKPRRLPLEAPVKGVLMNYQRGTVSQRPHYGLIQLEGITSVSDAAQYIGRSVILHFNDQKSTQGRIISAHGRNGVLRVRFRRGLAAEAVAKEVLVY